MFSSGKANYTKLRTNLRLVINRLKLLEKKKTELALKARKDIADYIAAGKEDRARIRVEHIVREDYLVEAMEIVEMFCDLILARFGLIEKMKELDPGLEESIATLIWVTPRLITDVPEFKEISHQFTAKYGKEYVEMCRKNGFENVNEQVLHKLSFAAPPKLLVENYMIEIAKTYKVPFEPDMFIMNEEGAIAEASDLISLEEDTKKPPGGDAPGGSGGFGGNSGGFGGGGGGGGDEKLGFPSEYSAGSFPQMPQEPSQFMPQAPSPYIPPAPLPGYHPPQPPPPMYTPGPNPGISPPGLKGPPPLPNRPPSSGPEAGIMPPGDMHPNLPPGFDAASMGRQRPESLPPYDDVMQSPDLYPRPEPVWPNQPSPNSSAAFPSGPNAPTNTTPPKPAPRSPRPAPRAAHGGPPPTDDVLNLPDLPELPGLPSVPSSTVGSASAGGQDIDFDDLSRRFEELKRKK